MRNPFAFFPSFRARTPGVEAKSLSTAASFYDLIGAPVPTLSGKTVTTQEALQVPAVANAVQLISEAVASLDVMVKRIEGTTEVDLPEHPVRFFLDGEANAWTSGFELIRQLMVDALTSDAGGMAWVNRVGVEVREIVRWRHGVLMFEVDQNTGERSYTLHGRPVLARDVIHVLPPLGRAPLSLAREAIATARALDAHAARLFTSGARPSGALLFPKGMGEESVKKARAAWRLTHEGENTSGQTAILFDGADFKPFTFNSTDAQFLENRRFQVLEIARAFNIPSPMIGDLERATWSNSEQKGREFLSYTLEPWLRAMEGALRRALFTDTERRSHVLRFDRDDLTRADLATRATVINSLISSRTINPNEGRDWLGLPPREGGEEFLNPNISAAPIGHNGGPALDQEDEDNAA